MLLSMVNNVKREEEIENWKEIKLIKQNERKQEEILAKLRRGLQNENCPLIFRLLLSRSIQLFAHVK